MKRSRTILLLTMGVSALALSACSSDDAQVEAHAFTSVDECAASATYEVRQCEDAFYAARDGYETAYPKYASKSECEEAAGEDECEIDRPNAKSRDQSWRPGFTAFLIGPGRVQPQALVASARSPSGYATAGGAQVARNGTAASLSRTAAARPQVATPMASPGATTVSRGGFGATGAAVASAGGNSGS